jgi:pimeloyl-ACP methyl ester carboxylesterase
MQERAIEVAGDDGVRLSARAFEPPSVEAPGLLLMHGLASSQHIWDLMLPRLTRRFRVVTYDARGHGQSGKPTSGYGFPHVVADARAVIRGTGLGRPMIAGHSWGAMVALELAAGHPRAIAGAVLVDGGVTSLREHMDWPTAKERLAPPKLIGMPATQFRGMIRTFFADAVHVTPDVEDIVMSVMSVRPDGTIAPYLSRANHFRILHAIWEQDLLSLYPRLQVPVHAIVAHRTADPDGSEQDEAKRVAVRRVREAAPGRPVTIAWMEGIHDLPLQHPAALTARILRSTPAVVG